jgi:hypothetical protein
MLSSEDSNVTVKDRTAIKVHSLILIVLNIAEKLFN